ncbi:MAG: ATP-binding cassette domain-containing protein [Candidatus Ancillula trichonymphae]|nr:ATP-binding cassette domain-containing protein [Candidatus Ancillula trichonymphae]
MLDFQNVNIIRSGLEIVSNVNWKVFSGENWVLLGPNGIGKSTLLNICWAHIFPTTGTAEIFRNRLGKVDIFELRRKIGILGADLGANILGSEVVFDVIRTAKCAMLGIWGDSRDDALFTVADDARADELLELFKIQHLKNRNWGVLSQGERKRVLMCRTLMPDPDLLLFDEPTAGLDLAARELVINILNKLALENAVTKRGRAIILVNHNVEEIPPSFNKIAIMGARNTNPQVSCEQKQQPQTGTILFQGDIDKNLTSEKLTRAYGVDLNVQKLANLRYFASASVIISEGDYY